MSLTAYRWWIARQRRYAGWQLRSLVMRQWWEGPHLRAPVAPREWRCRADGGPHSCTWGHPQCRCGIYALKSERLTLNWVPWSQTPREGCLVWGAVALWGRVVEHEKGYRAEHAMIRRLVVPRRIWIRSCRAPCANGLPLVDVDRLPQPSLVEALGRQYGVDVDLGDEIEVHG